MAEDKRKSDDEKDEKETFFRRRFRGLGIDFRKKIEDRFAFEPDDPLVAEQKEKARRPIDPKIGFWEIFRKMDGQGEKVSLKRISQLGEYHMRRFQEWIKELRDRARGDPDDVFNKADRLGDFWNDTSADAAARDEATNAARDKAMAGEGRAERMEAQGTEVGPARGRVRFEPDNPENRVNSNHVGPERQVTMDEGARDRSGRPKGAVTPAPRLLAGPEEPRQEKTKRSTDALPGQVPEARRIGGPGQPGSGSDAAEKGAAIARRKRADEAGRAGSQRRRKRDADLEM